MLRLLDPLRSKILWYKQENDFARFLSKIKTHVLNPGKEEVLIIIQPWTLTPLPWYLISLGIGFHFQGKRVHIIFDDIGLGVEDRQEKFQKESISRILKKIPTFVKFQTLSEFIPAGKDLSLSFDLDRLVRKNKTIHYRGESFPSGSDEFEKDVSKALNKTAAYVDSVFKNFRPSYIVLGGGGYGSSGVWMDMAKAYGIRVASIDSGNKILLLSTDGIAANLEDIPRAFSQLPKEDIDWVIAEGKAELKRRMQGKDQFNSQNVPSTGEIYSYGIVLPLNQSYDLSSLERHNVFKNQTEWILETIEWVLNNSNEKIAIRRHPVERYKIYRSNDDYEKDIKDRFGISDRIRFIDSKEDINTYDLMKNAKVVVPYISTVGAEAAALGKIVVTEGASCYSGLGFVWSASSREQYFEFLKKAVNNELEITEIQSNNAWQCYYLTQCCNWHSTIFTPQPNNYKEWVLEDPEELLLREDVIDVLNAIEKNIPLPILAHNRRKRLKEIEFEPVPQNNNNT